MNAFVIALREREPMERIASFFPREGAWELVRTPERAPPGAAVERLRFEPGQTLREISEGGSVCDSFGGVSGDVGPQEGAIVSAAWERGAWRYTGRGRFVPPGAHRDSPVYVEWTRERGTWVIARIGEESWYEPRVIGTRAAGQVTRDTAAARELPPERRHAIARRLTGPLYYGIHWYLRYGLPRMLPESELVRFGSVDGVPVFVERAAAPTPEILYVLVDPGEYQPFNAFGHSICRD
jgi:hypothetical protein